MKKYKKPAMRVIKMEQAQMICGSDPHGESGSRETNSSWGSDD